MFLNKALPVPQLDLIALYMLLLFVGVVVGGDRRAWELVKRAHWRVALAPAATAVGTVLGVAALAALCHGLSVGRAVAVGAGFGYYSLSSVLLTRLTGSEELGVVALVSNILRELMTLVAAPLLVRWFGRLAPVAAGGATAMDTTLPVITRCSGKAYAVVAVFSGFILTLAVPVLLPLLIRWVPPLP